MLPVNRLPCAAAIIWRRWTSVSTRCAAIINATMGKAQSEYFPLRHGAGSIPGPNRGSGAAGTGGQAPDTADVAFLASDDAAFVLGSAEFQRWRGDPLGGSDIRATSRLEASCARAVSRRSGIECLVEKPSVAVVTQCLHLSVAHFIDPFVLALIFARQGVTRLSR